MLDLDHTKIIPTSVLRVGIGLTHNDAKAAGGSEATLDDLVSSTCL